MRCGNDREEMPWLGWEALVYSNHARPDRSRLPRCRASEVMTLLAGELVTLLTMPESGMLIRNRLKRGKETAGKEFDELVGEAMEEWTAVGGDVREAVKRTASRVKQAAELTKEALTFSDASVRRVP